MSTWLIGEAARPAPTRSVSVSSVSQNPPPVPPSVKAGRTTSGSPASAANARASDSDDTVREVGHRLTDAVEQRLEQAAILGRADRVQRRPQNAQPVAFDDAGVGQLDGQVESRLAAEGRQQPVRPLGGDDPLDDRRR